MLYKMKKNYVIKTVGLFFAVATAFSSQGQSVSDFENLILPVDSFWDGADFSGQFKSGDASFNNIYDQSFFYWTGGFSYSNKKDTSTVGYTNQQSTYAGRGVNNSSNFAIGSTGSVITLTGAALLNELSGVYITNSTYSATSMRDGDSFAKKFGGTTGNDSDWFKLTVFGYQNGQLKSDSVEFYLADYRFFDNAKDYIVKEWTWVDLSVLGIVDSLSVSLSSSDVGSFGINTPAFFCIDNFNGTPPKYETIVIYDTTYVTVTDTLIIKAVITGVLPPNNTNTLKVFPNPASTHITIDNGNFSLLTGYSLKINNSLGQTVFESEIMQQQFQINLSSWSGNGIYFIHIIDDQNNILDIRKIVLQ